MTSKRLLGCVLLAFLGAAVQAQVPTDDIGPVEKRARPITPENPFPKRIHSVDPIYPPEAATIGATARVTLRAVVDEFGRVAEVRRLSLPIVTSGSQPKPDPAVLKFATEALLEAAADAVRRWQYEAPIDGPVAFDVSFRFAPGSVTFMGPQRGATQATVTVRPAPPPRAGSNPRTPRTVALVSPVYPAEAQAAGVQGVVVMEATIGVDGSVTGVRVLRSIPLLDQAAMAAVRQWRYAPTVVEGAAVPVVLTVTVQFTLN